MDNEKFGEFIKKLRKEKETKKDIDIDKAISEAIEKY